MAAWLHEVSLASSYHHPHIIDPIVLFHPRWSTVSIWLSSGLRYSSGCVRGCRRFIGAGILGGHSATTSTLCVYPPCSWLAFTNTLRILQYPKTCNPRLLLRIRRSPHPRHRPRSSLHRHRLALPLLDVYLTRPASRGLFYTLHLNTAAASHCNLVPVTLTASPIAYLMPSDCIYLTSHQHVPDAISRLA